MPRAQRIPASVSPIGGSQLSAHTLGMTVPSCQGERSRVYEGERPRLCDGGLSPAPAGLARLEQQAVERTFMREIGYAVRGFLTVRNDSVRVPLSGSLTVQADPGSGL